MCVSRRRTFVIANERDRDIVLDVMEFVGLPWPAVAQVDVHGK